MMPARRLYRLQLPTQNPLFDRGIAHSKQPCRFSRRQHRVLISHDNSFTPSPPFLPPLTHSPAQFVILETVPDTIQSRNQDEVFMRRALQLPSETLGLASPNPHEDCALTPPH